MAVESLENIQRAKEELGFSSNTDTVFFAALNDRSTITKAVLINPTVATATGKYFIGSIEQNGILLLNMNATIGLKLKEGHSFIPFDTIQDLTISKPSKGMAILARGKMNFLTLIITTIDGKKTNLSVYKHMGLSKASVWVQENIHRIESLIENNELPIGHREANQFVQSSTEAPIERQVSQTNFCTNCGNKLSDGQKFCSKCGARIYRS